MKFLELSRAIQSTQFLIERDVANAPSVKTWVLNLAQRVRDANARKWFQSQLFNHLINDSQDPNIIQALTRPPADAPEWLHNKIMSGGNVFNINPNEATARIAGEVVDWVNAWADEHPGARINYTWEQAEAASVAWHKELAQGQEHGDETPDDDGLGLIKQYPDGFRWVDVKSETCLKREGGRMGHCVGSYGGAVSDGSTRVLSLRSPKNTPHVTIEVNDLHAEWWLAQSDATDPDQTVMDFMKSNLMDGDVVGKINQIKGKQNKAPVPKYIPYVKDLLDTYPFAFTGGGERDLETVGWYVRDNTIVGLKDIARPFHKLANGQQWVVMTNPANKQVTSLGSIKLVDKAWTPLVSVTLRPSPTDASSYVLGTEFTTSGDPLIYREQLLQLIRDKSSTISVSPMNAWSLSRFGIYIGPNGNGTPTEAANGRAVQLPSCGLHIAALYDFTVRYSTKTTTKLYIFDQQDAVMGVVQIALRPSAGTDENPKTSSSAPHIIRLDFTSPFRGDYNAALIDASRELKLPIYSPIRFGIDEHGNTIDVIGEAKHVGVSNNGHYDYYTPDDFETIIVVRNGTRSPLATVVIIDGDIIHTVTSGRYSTDNDCGLLGYIRIDLQTQRIVEGAVEESELTEVGWTKLHNTHVYANGTKSLQIHLKTISVTDDEEATLMDENMTVGNLPSYIAGDDAESFLPIYAQIAYRGDYADETETLEGVEYTTITLTDSRDVEVLQYRYYDHDQVMELIS